jgi:hypothetical protein
MRTKQRIQSRLFQCEHPQTRLVNTLIRPHVLTNRSIMGAAASLIEVEAGEARLSCFSERGRTRSRRLKNRRGARHSQVEDNIATGRVTKRVVLQRRSDRNSSGATATFEMVFRHCRAWPNTLGLQCTASLFPLPMKRRPNLGRKSGVRLRVQNRDAMFF